MPMGYKELMAQANELIAQAEAARKQEVSAAIDRIKEVMEEYKLTFTDLKNAGVIVDAPVAITNTPTTPKYRGPNGELWVGGRGRKPDWALKVIQEGGSLDTYKITKP